MTVAPRGPSGPGMRLFTCLVALAGVVPAGRVVAEPLVELAGGAGYQPAPSREDNYCQGGSGVELSVAAGGRVGEDVSLLIDGYAFTTGASLDPAALSGAITVQAHWDATPTLWLRGGAGGGYAGGHNSDGGWCGGTSFVATATGGWRLGRHVDLRLQARLHRHQLGWTPIATLAVGVTW